MPTKIAAPAITATVEAIMARSRARFGHGAFVMVTPTLEQHIEHKRRQLVDQDARRAATATIQAVRAAADAAGRQINAAEAGRINAADDERRRIDSRNYDLLQEIDRLERQLAADQEADRLASISNPTGVRGPGYEGSAYTGDGRPPTVETGNARPTWVRTHDQQPAVVARGQRWVEQPIVADHAARNAGREAPVIGQHGSLGQLVRSMTTSSGSAVVPTVWASDIIDRARNLAAVMQAGAEIVPMDAKTVQIGRLAADPTAAFRAEGSTITASDPTFDNVTLTANTMSALVVGSMEWFMDADNVDDIVSEAIAKAFALQLDMVALYGAITTGAGSVNLPLPPNPRGVLAALNAVASSSVLGAATNGTAQTTGSYWSELMQLLYTPRNYNEAPNALIYNAKLALQYANSYDTTGQPLRLPQDLEELPRFISNQIPSYTQGTMANRATDVFAGDWTQLLIGQRLDFTVQTLVERYAENGQVGIVAHWRGDIGVARPRAFAVYKALQGAS